jgi:RNA polymerase sigma-70 factor, ECF subfamily
LPEPPSQPGPGPPPGGSTSLTLIEQIRVRDQEAWKRLVVLYTPMIRHWCRRWGVQGEDAEDVLQEVFQAVAIGLKDFRRDRAGDSFRGWLRGIARNKALDLFRRRGLQAPGGTDFYRRSLEVPARREGHAEADEEADGPEVEGALYQQALIFVRGEFEDRTWQAFWRAAVDGQPPAVIAEELGVSAAAVRQSKSRVLRRLKDVLGEPPRSPSRPVRNEPGERGTHPEPPRS